MARYGWWKYLRGIGGKNVAADDSEHDDDVHIPYLYIWCDGIPPSGQLDGDFPIGSAHSAGCRGIRYFHVLATAACQDVNELVLAMGGAQFLDGGNCLSHYGYGPRTEGIGVAVSAEALFHDIPVADTQKGM